MTRGSDTIRGNNQMKGEDVPRGARNTGIDRDAGTTNGLTTLRKRELSCKVPSVLHRFGVNHITVYPTEAAGWFRAGYTDTMMVVNAMTAEATNRAHSSEASPRSNNVATRRATTMAPTTRAARMASIGMPT